MLSPNKPRFPEEFNDAAAQALTRALGPTWLTAAELEFAPAIQGGTFSYHDTGASAATKNFRDFNDRRPNDRLNNPAGGFRAKTRERRTLRAEFIKWVLLHPDAPEWFRKSGFELWYARIEGPLDMGFCRLPFSVRFLACWFGGGWELPEPRLEDAHVSFRYAKLFSLSFSGCTVDKKKNVCLRGVHLKRSLFLWRGFDMKGHLDLRNARVEGDLDLRGAKVDARAVKGEHAGHAVDAEGVEVQGTVYLSNGFKARGRVDLHQAIVRGDMNGIGGSFENPENVALRLRKARIEGSVLLCHRHPRGAAGVKQKMENGKPGFPTRLIGQLTMERARIGGNLLLSRALLRHPVLEGSDKRLIDSPHFAVQAEGLQVDGEIKLDRARVIGQLRFENAKIGGDFFGEALHVSLSEEIERARVAKLPARPESRYKVLSLEKACVGGSVILWRSEIQEPGEEEKEFFRKKGFLPARLEGVVDFRGTRVEGNIALAGAKIGRLPVRASLVRGHAKRELPPPALLAEGLHVNGRVGMDGGFEARGKVSFHTAEIGGNFTVRGSRLLNEHDFALDLQHAQIGGSFLLETQLARRNPEKVGAGPLAETVSRRCTVRGSINLAGATVKGNVMIRGAQCVAANPTRSGHTRRFPHPLRASVCARGAAILGHVQICAGRTRSEENHPGVEETAKEMKNASPAEKGRPARFFGPIDFRRTNIAGTLSILEAEMFAEREGKSPKTSGVECALRLEGATIGGSIQTREHLPHKSAREGALFRGGIDLRNAHVAGDLNLHHARLIGDVWHYTQRDNTTGTSRAHKYNDSKGRPACWATNAVIEGNATFRESRVFGVITFYSAKVGGRLNLRDIAPYQITEDFPLVAQPREQADKEPATEEKGSVPEKPEEDHPYLSIDLEYLRCDVLQASSATKQRPVHKRAWWRRWLGLRNANEPLPSEYRDNRKGTNALPGCLFLEGLTYRGLDIRTGVGGEIRYGVADWLEAQHDEEWRRKLHTLGPTELHFPPQPYRLAVAVLERQGLKEQAEEVVRRHYDLERAILEAQTWQWQLHRNWHLGLWKRLWDQFRSGHWYLRMWKRLWLVLDAKLLHHGYSHGYAAFALFITWALGVFFFSMADWVNCMVPTQPAAWHEIVEGEGFRHPELGWSPYYPHFRSLVYSLDLCIPFADFGQQDFWEPNHDWMKPHPHSPAKPIADAEQSVAPMSALATPTAQRKSEGTTSAPPGTAAPVPTETAEASGAPLDREASSASAAPATRAAGVAEAARDAKEDESRVRTEASPASKSATGKGDRHVSPVPVKGKDQTVGQKVWGNIAFYYLPFHIIAGWFFSTLALLGLTRQLRNRHEELPGSE